MGKKRLTAADLAAMGVKVFRMKSGTGGYWGPDCDVYYGINPDYAVGGWMADCHARRIVRWEGRAFFEALGERYSSDKRLAAIEEAIAADNGHLVEPSDKDWYLTDLADELNRKWTAVDVLQMGIKKTFIDWNPLPTLFPLPTLSAFSGYTSAAVPKFELYHGLDGCIDGGWLASSNGKPVCEGVLYGDEGKEIIAAVRTILENENAPWYDIYEEDAEFLAEYFEVRQTPHPNL